MTNKLNDPFSITNTIDLTTSVTDTLYCYDTTMNSTNYPTTSIYPTGSNVYITNTGTTTPNWNINDTITLGNLYPSPLKVVGDAEIEGKLKVGGKDISKALEKIEEHLAILHPDPKLESKWEELKNIRNQYEKLKQEIIEKEKIYDILSK